MEGRFNLCAHLGVGLELFLEQISDAVLVLDEERALRFVNDRARRLLGYEKGETIDGRCRLTTKGVDCSNACPLTFILEGQLESVQEFRTVYHTRDGDPVPLNVTVIPLSRDNGEFGGAVEILRPTKPDPGFFAAGRGSESEALKRHIMRLSEDRRPVVLVGEAAACVDVAAAIHRYSGMPDDLFLTWTGAWEGRQAWPAGTVYSIGAPPDGVDGWRVIVGTSSLNGLKDDFRTDAEILKLPSVSQLGHDIPIVIRAWIEQRRPSTDVTAEALSLLCQVASERGLDELEATLTPILETTSGTVEASDFCDTKYRSILLDEVLEAEDPIAALEQKLLFEVLNECEWRMQEAADRLGVSRVTLWRKLKDHGIAKP